MTLIDSADLQARTCPRCGAVYGDALIHHRWHRAEEDAVEELAATLVRFRELAEDLRRQIERQEEYHR